MDINTDSSNSSDCEFVGACNGGHSMQRPRSTIEISDTASEESQEDFEITSHGFTVVPEVVKKEVAYKAEYQVLSVTDIVILMNSKIAEVNERLCLPLTVTRALLSHFQWDFEKTIEAYMDNNVRALEKANIVIPEKSDTHETDCLVCFSSLEDEEAEGLECGHLFCVSCWSGYFQNKIMEEGLEIILCIQPECKAVVDDSLITKIMASRPEVLSIYHKTIIEKFILSHSKMGWCPQPDCEMAMQVISLIYPSGICSCGKGFCVICKEVYHDPISCDLLSQWQKVNPEKYETEAWIEKNSKPCPRCKAPIEKNGGCNHMTCRRGCGYEFCWVCMGNWKGHQGCNVFQPASQTNQRNNPEQLLIRYKHYKERYETHRKSWILERQLTPKIQQLISCQTSEEDKEQLEFLDRGISVLSDCRLILQNTFIFAFFVIANNQTAIFEENQRDLEKATEELSGLLESDLSFDCLKTLQESIMTKYDYCKRRHQALLQHLAEGYEKGYFNFNE